MKTVFTVFLSLGLSCGYGFAAEKPNILLILADDLGWSDLGCYGGEIRTPSLDALAKDGIRFTQFYNSARCSPSRASILTGLHPHQAGFPNLSGTLSKSAVTLPEVLSAAGYRSYMVGKWHLNGKNPPTERGFDEFYGMLGGFNSCWQENAFYTRWPEGRQKREYASGAFYSTDAFGDYALDFLRDGQKSGKPWFLYLAFNAPHFPLHAPEADIATYEALYFEKGWDRIREERLARQKQLGLVPRDLALTPRSVVPANGRNNKTGWADKENPAWDSLPEDRRRDLSRRMAVYAAMVDRMDRAVGRVVGQLKASGQFDNTLIFFLSDNGACAEWDPWGFDNTSGPLNILHTGDDLKTVGGPASYASYGSGWAHACNTPWRLFKHYSQEGGVRTPCIVHWPAGLQAKGLVSGPGYITDFMPTLCEAAGAPYPKERDGLAILPAEGISLMPALRGEPLAPRRIFIEHEGNRSVRDGDWKLVALREQPWELYNLAADPAEMRNLAAQQPQRVRELAAAWEGWAERCNVVEKRDKQSAAAESRNKPNIVFILTDDMGYGDIGCNGGTFVPTPNIDSLAREGIRFTQYTSASPICSPSRAGCTTGQFPARWRITSFLQTRDGNRACGQADFLDPKAPSIARRLRSVGYATGHFGKWHMGGGRDVSNAPPITAYGFDEYASTWESPDPHPDITASDWIWSPKDKVKRWDRTAFFVDKALDFLRRHKGSPCYVNVWPDDMHTPWVPADDVPKGDSPENFRRVLAEYDRQIGRLLDGLKELGLATNTLVLFTSDNGPLPTFKGERAGGLRGSKMSLYEGGIRMPCVVRWPGHTVEGRVDGQTVWSAVDLFPSLCAVAGARLPQGVAFDGEDVSAAWSGITVERTKPLYWEYGRNDTAFKYPHGRDRSPNVAVREGNWKVLVNADGSGAQLYDLAADPKEERDLVSVKPAVTKRLVEQALSWRRTLP